MAQQRKREWLRILLWRRAIKLTSVPSVPFASILPNSNKYPRTKDNFILCEGFQDSTHGSLIGILPTEILDMVFDYVRYTDFRKQTLFACSLVSKRWQSLTLYHRFITVSLNVSSKATPEISASNCFLQDFLESELFPMVQRGVQILTLSWSGNPIELYGLRYVERFPALRSLELRGRVYERLFLPSPSLRFAFPDTLATLSVMGSTPDPSRQYPHCIWALYDLLSLFESVSKLRLGTMYWWGKDEGFPEVGLLPRLTSLAFSNIAVPRQLYSLLRPTPL